MTKDDLKTRVLNVGVIGLGRISSRHIDDSIKKLNELRLVAVCDINEDLAKLVGEKENVPYYKNYNDLVENKEVDLVAVCTPNGLHYEIGMAVARAGKHCIMEKPISIKYEEARNLANEFESRNLCLFPVLQVRYNPTVIALRNIVKEGNLGRVITGSLIIRWQRPEEYFSESSWKGTKKMDGGTLLTQGIHYVDIMQHVLGPVKSVYGKTATVAHHIEVEDIANAIIDFQSGARINLEFTVCAYPQNIECSLTILGETGTIKMGGMAMNKCDMWQVKNYPQPFIPEGISPNQYAGGMYTGSCPNHIAIYSDAINTLLNNQKQKIIGSDALESIRIIEAIKESSEKGKEINLI